MKIILPTQLRNLNNGADSLTVEPSTTLRDAIGKVPEPIRDRILDPATGSLRRFINAFIGEEDARFLADDPLDAPVNQVGEVTLVPAIAGG